MPNPPLNRKSSHFLLACDSDWEQLCWDIYRENLKKRALELETIGVYAPFEGDLTRRIVNGYE